MRSVLIALALAVPHLASAAPAKLTLDEVIAKALASPRARMAGDDRDAAKATVDQADAARAPRVKVTAFGTISPDITCRDPGCTMTDPQNFSFDFKGLYGSAQLDITQPLFTFGKLSHARAAARAGLDAQQALADEAAGDLVSDAARAYWGLKVARELGDMLDDGIEQIAHAKDDFEAEAKTGKGSVTIQDRQRVAVLLAEAKAQRAEAAQAEGEALAGLRALVGSPDADIDDTELAAVDHALPDAKTLDATAIDQRPQARAARSGAKAGDELADLEHAGYFPDFALVASAVASKAQGVTDPPGAFANNPYNRYGAGVVLGLSWTLEPWNVSAREGKAKAQAHHAHALADLAADGARLDADSALAQAKAAHDKVDAAGDGEKAARTWLAAVLQNQAIGAAESRDLADAYIAWFQMRARWATAVMQWNVAVVRLGRAAGEFRATGGRPN